MTEIIIKHAYSHFLTFGLIIPLSGTKINSSIN